MAKNIVICSDGTGATAAKNRGTNVFKLYEAVELRDHRVHPGRVPQITFYDDGVGSQGWKPLKLLGGACGLGFSVNVRQLYAELARTYEPGDRIYFFGFSRGAFTVRTVAGIVTKFGLLDRTRFQSDKSLLRGVKCIYTIYRLTYSTVVQRLFDRLLRRSRRLARRRGAPWRFVGGRLHEDAPRIHFIGVWDTVDALGFPDDSVADLVNSVFYRFKFPNYALHDRVDRACQALAIDDERATFHPLLWDESRSSRSGVTQVWFSGAHSNVGGGYPKHGMSLVALNWMMGEAEAAGLRFIPGLRAEYRDRENVNDKLADSRGGLAFFYRYEPRDIWRACEEYGVTPAIHVSALERVAQQTEGYSPGNVPCSSTLVETRGARAPGRLAALSGDVETFLTERLGEWALAAGFRRRLRRPGGDAHAPHSLLDLARPAASARSVSHYIFLGAVVALAFLAWPVLQEQTGGVWPMSGGRLQALQDAFLRGICSGAWEALLAAVLLLVIIVSLVTAVRARVHMERDFSEFWYSALPTLRRMMADRLP